MPRVISATICFMLLNRCKSIFIGGLLALLVVALTACSSSPSPSTSTHTGATSTKTNTTYRPTQTVPSPSHSSWHIQYSSPIGSSGPSGQAVNVFTGISCADTLHCQAIGGSAQSAFMLGTADGGTSWAKEGLPSFIGPSSGGPGVTGIDCPSATTCFALTQHEYTYGQGGNVGGGIGAAIITTGDSGSTWSLQTTIANTEYFDAISCPNASLCFASGNGFIAETTNGGGSWSRLQAVPSGMPDLTGISCAAVSTCVALGQSAIIYTTDGGSTWLQSQPPKGVVGLSAVSCPTRSVCYALAGLGTSNQGNTATYGNVVIKSTNGGATWSKGKSLSNGLPIRILCPIVSSCYIVGYSSSQSGGSVGMILFSSNSGASWAEQSAPKQVDDVQDISCASVNRCWAIGGAELQGPQNQSLAGNFTTGYIITN